MKRLALLLIAGLALASCSNGVDITRNLSAEDAAIVPYQSGQTIQFVNTITNDTLNMTVTDDQTSIMRPSEEDEYTRFSVFHNDTYSYCRYLTLCDDYNLYRMFFIVRPDKKFDFTFRAYEEHKSVSIDFDLNKINPAPTTTIDGLDFNNVYYHNLEDGGTIAFSTEKGLILIRTADSCAYRLIP